jgi:hypothetical protein
VRRATVTCLLLIGIVLLAKVTIGATLLSVSVSDVEPTSVRISWSQTQDVCFESYRIEYREAGFSSWTTDTSIGSASTTSTWIYGLDAGTRYGVRVVDVDCLGSRTSNPVPFTMMSAATMGIFAGFPMNVVIE